ncbi:MAG: WecB/TagA/CpsF family glycosyltransferase [Undibacterium sp.]
MHIFHIGIDNLSRTDVLKRIDDWLGQPGFHRIATVNPEFLLLSEKNKAFRGALLSADLRVADGFGLHLPFFLAGETLIERIPGADLLSEILVRANEERLSIGLMLDPGGLSKYEEIRTVLLKTYPNLTVEKFAPEYLLGTNPAPYHIVFCNYGAPLQEIVLAGLKAAPGNIRLAMGVGGAFDFLTGKVPRAPKALRAIGLEWLWRLWQQPKRWKRIWNAVIVFPTKVFCQK